jgi:hypothetical protein
LEEMPIDSKRFHESCPSHGSHRIEMKYVGHEIESVDAFTFLAPGFAPKSS